MELGALDRIARATLRDDVLGPVRTAYRYWPTMAYGRRISFREAFAAVDAPPTLTDEYVDPLDRRVPPACGPALRCRRSIEHLYLRRRLRRFLILFFRSFFGTRGFVCASSLSERKNSPSTCVFSAMRFMRRFVLMRAPDVRDRSDNAYRLRRVAKFRPIESAR